MLKILVVDDEPSIVTLLKYNLEKNNFSVITADTGLTAIEMVKKEQPDLIFLDVMLPGLSGVDVTSQLRHDQIETPIIMITALDDEIDKVLGLEIGADDYVTKPFNPREVIARARAVLRRYDVKKQSNVTELTNGVTVGDVTIDFDKMVVQKNGKYVKLTPKEYELLAYMAERAGRVLDRETILHGVWGFEFTGLDTRMVDMHLSHLRDKIEDNPKEPTILKTVRGFGYRFDLSPEK
ncbi:response regulator transcription factor [Weissella diestrammenae]|uniref:Response regulator transcription factor n=1 Tax=Weissella diestrammenae TaxID=1162633 RepID=A0A7G9T5L1_9LACO|nr:response regulator transcription factor [Weissella diestrammenae]MCM0582213.1 response regulator transcription factor [Weissella diestrammenae]QNN75386.1 response regulator transcription factor [Weissella diestrammenae]